MLRELDLLACSGCGAGLPAIPGQDSVTCLFCDATTPIDDTLTTQAEVPPLVAELDDEARQAFVRAEIERGAMTMFGILFSIYFTVAIVLSIGMGTYIVASITDLLHLTRGLKTAAPAAAVILSPFPLGLLFALWLAIRFTAPARRAKKLMKDLVQREALTARCPGCGGPIQVPPLAARLACPSCSNPLLTADGMLIAWKEDAEDRRDLWTAEAMRVAEENASRDAWQSVLAPVVMVVAPTILVLGFAVTLAVLRAVGL